MLTRPGTMVGRKTQMETPPRIVTLSHSIVHKNSFTYVYLCSLSVGEGHGGPAEFVVVYALH